MKNKMQLSIGFVIKTLIVSTVTTFLLTALIGGFSNFGNAIPNTVSANEKTANSDGFPLSGINDPAAVSDEQNNVEIYRAAAPGVVLISTGSGSGRGDLYSAPDEESGTGSGVVFDSRGYILTNEHVVRGGSNLTVNLGGDLIFKAQLVGSDPDTDLAVIKIDAPAFFNSDSVRRFGSSHRRAEGSRHRQSIRSGQNFDNRSHQRFAASNSFAQRSSD